MVETATNPNAATEAAKRREQQAQTILSTSSDFIEDGKIKELFIDDAIDNVNRLGTNTDHKAIASALLAINDQLVLLNRAISVLIQNQVMALQMQQRQQGGLVMPRGPMPGLK